MKDEFTYYDYIICGGGCAGLTLAMQLSDTCFHDKSILIIDKDDKTVNDRTWCFWETEKTPSLYAEVVSNIWNEIVVSDKSRVVQQSLSPLTYKRIRSIDFYDKAKALINEAPHITWRKDEIKNINRKCDQIEVSTITDVFHSELCFNSIPVIYKDTNEYQLKQHFLGWIIRFDKPILDQNIVELMDFKVPQKEKEVRFSYVLPINEMEAMIEFTIFSESLLDDRQEYESFLRNYISEKYDSKSYEIIEEEYGVIPMSTQAYQPPEEANIINIGNRSGRIKPSSGYAFKRIQEEITHIVKNLKQGRKPDPLTNQNRFLFYDKILFNVLLNKRMRGDDIFVTMFEKNKAPSVLKFLGEKTSLLEEALIFSRLPILPFLKAMISEVFRRLTNK